MSKNYKHQPPHQVPSTECQANTRLLKENEALKAENNRLEMALKLMTGENKQELLDAIEYIEGMKNVTQWHTVCTGTTVLSSPTITIGTLAI